MAKKPIKKKAAKKAAKPAKKAAPKKAAKKVAKPVKKAAKKVAKKTVKKVAKKAVKKVASKKPLALPASSTPSKATPLKAVVKGRIPDQKTPSQSGKVVAAKAAFDTAGWSKMSDSQRRVFMATACIKFMERGLKVAKGNYIASDSLDAQLRNLSQRSDLKDLLENVKDVSCCGVGILLYADVLLRGGYDVYKGNNLNKVGLNDIQNRLRYFNSDQLKQIECAFETSWAFSADDKLSIPAIAFGARITDDRRRMSAILKNIVENDGNFRP